MPTVASAQTQPDQKSARRPDEHGRARIPVLYLAPWIDFGGTDKNTIDWFRFLDRDRFAPYLITTQPSPNRRLGEVTEFAEEIWVLPDMMPAEAMPGFILDFLSSRDIRVIHLMNSRLGFDLLPDINCLPDPPAVIAQLHVEEADRSGYVRYLTTRYGNMVDRFSVSNKHLEAAIHKYGIPNDRTKVIYIGVDADKEFSPLHVDPVEGLAEDRVHLLFPARLTDQKDPLLMVEVAAALKQGGLPVQVHALGEGDLETDVRARIAALELGDDVLIHPPTATPQRWYAACDAVLMTSVFEGIPAVVFEAMAIGIPIVAPALHGNVELLGDDYPGLVRSRDAIAEYVSAVRAVVADGEGRGGKIGEAMRARARGRFSLRQMADDHGSLYEEVASLPLPRPQPSILGDAPIRFRNRPVRGEPLVSIIVPHYNQGQFLDECVDSIRSQTYPELELIVVDDASTDADAKEALDRLEADGGLTLIRLADNGGPSRARNLGIDRCRGRYVLPVDSDNVLLPDAVEKLVEQLSCASEEIGFVYPNIQFVGNREDYYEVPDYNLHTLLHGNFCDTCSLLDREIFDAGERYRESIKLGHEDWEFVLRLASRGVRGEAARFPTLLYRKWGFNRSDIVDHSPEAFEDLLAEISPFRGNEAKIKAEESPALSLIPLAPIDAAGEVGRAVASRLEAQQNRDAELIARFDGRWPSESGPRVRRIPSALSDSPLEALRQGMSLARGSFIATSAGDCAGLLADPAFVAKVLRRFAVAPELGAIVLADVVPDAAVPFHTLAEDDLPEGPPHTVIWRRTEEQYLPHGPHADPGDTVQSIARFLSGAGCKLEWRYAPGSGSPEEGRPSGHWAELPPSRAVAEDPHGHRPGAKPTLSGAGSYVVPRWENTPSWIPPLSSLVIRYREKFGERRLATSGPPPVGYEPEHHMGALHSTALEGTVRVVRVADRYRALPRGEWASLPADAEELGYADIAQFPGLDVLASATHKRTRQPLVVTLPEDPILHEVDVVESLGCLEPFPLKPRDVPVAQRPDGLIGLLKAADHEVRRFRYAIDSVPPGELLGEIGGLAATGLQGQIPAWIVDGYLLTDRHRPPRRWLGATAAVRWVGEPVAWAGLAPRSAQAKAVLRRSAAAVRRLRSPEGPEAEPESAPAAWLFERARPGLSPLFASYHPVSGDQLLVRSPEEAAQLGYLAPALLGFIRPLSPLTGERRQRTNPIPWARRFGAVPRTW